MTIELSKLGELYADTRGQIINLLEQPCGGVSVIWSKAGSRRSDHHHVSDGHWLWVMNGRMEYYERPVGSTEKPEHVTVEIGQMIWTGPGIEHATLFPVDTVLISMSLRPRDHASHEADLVRLAEPLPIE